MIDVIEMVLGIIWRGLQWLFFTWFGLFVLASIAFAIDDWMRSASALQDTSPDECDKCKDDPEHPGPCTAKHELH